MSSIIFENLTKRFKSTIAVDRFNLQVNSGELIALLGPSGCGKTTTLQLLAGFISPDRGRIIVNEQVISSPEKFLPPEKRNMSLIFQSYAIWPHLNVFDNVAFGLKLRKIKKKELQERVFQALCLVHLEKLAHRYPAELSGGQQQRVALARAVVVKPQILLLDEPLSNLDAGLRETMRNEILSLHQRLKLTTIYVTHDQTEALTLADKVVVMAAGQIQQVDTPENIYERPATELVANFIGRCNLLPALVCSRNSVQVDEIIFQVPDIAENISIGDRVSLCIRPHAIIIQPISNFQPEKVNHLRTQVQSSRYFGEFREYQLKIEHNNTIVTARSHPDINQKPGTLVDIFIPIASCRVLRSQFPYL
jgi:iron(III) transport system ATP-binding protein